MKYHFFYNPYSRGFLSKKWVLEPIINRFGKENIHETLKDPQEMFRKYSKIIDNDTVVIGLGGDGTLNILVNAFVEKTDKFSLFPCGTANVIVGELGITHDIYTFLNGLENAEIIRIDAGDNNGNKFLLCTGLGIDAIAVKKVSNRLKKIFGPLAYVFSFFRAIFHERVDVKLIVDGDLFTVKSAVIQNFKNYGGSFYFDPDVSAEDGFLSLIVLEDENKNIFSNLLNIFKRKKAFIKAIHFKELYIEDINEKVFFQVDGDISNNFIRCIKVIPDAIGFVLVK